MNQQGQQASQIGADQALNNQVINIDQSLLQNPGGLPVSLSITDAFGNIADGNLAAQVSILEAYPRWFTLTVYLTTRTSN